MAGKSGIDISNIAHVGNVQIWHFRYKTPFASRLRVRSIASTLGAGRQLELIHTESPRFTALLNTSTIMAKAIPEEEIKLESLQCISSCKMESTLFYLLVNLLYKALLKFGMGSKHNSLTVFNVWRMFKEGGTKMDGKFIRSFELFLYVSMFVIFLQNETVLSHLGMV